MPGRVCVSLTASVICAAFLFGYASPTAASACVLSETYGWSEEEYGLFDWHLAYEDTDDECPVHDSEYTRGVEDNELTILKSRRCAWIIAWRWIDLVAPPTSIAIAVGGRGWVEDLPGTPPHKKGAQQAAWGVAVIAPPSVSPGPTELHATLTAWAVGPSEALAEAYKEDRQMSRGGDSVPDGFLTWEDWTQEWVSLAPPAAETAGAPQRLLLALRFRDAWDGAYTNWNIGEATVTYGFELDDTEGPEVVLEIDDDRGSATAAFWLFGRSLLVMRDPARTLVSEPAFEITCDVDDDCDPAPNVKFSINGIPFPDDKGLRLTQRDGDQESGEDDRDVWIRASDFYLTATAKDASGNPNTAGVLVPDLGGPKRVVKTEGAGGTVVQFFPLGRLVARRM